MKNILFIPATLLFLLLSMSAFGQQKFSLEGIVINENQEILTGATVVLLHAKDSIMVSYAISGQEGQFQLKRITEGDYILQITYIGYQNYSKAYSFSGDEGKLINLKPIQLSPASELLDEVLVKSEHIPIRLNHDTIEYNADAFKTRPNAVVEELLKRLPGIEVDRDGTIKAQGKEVENVFVDGKEFFGKDPQMATKNLPADAIDKVQVFDKKSDMAEFTGVDDGEREKTINLALKEGKKNGYFGKVTGEYGNMNRYNGRANINHFNKKMQASVIGNFNNINQQGFSVNDYINFMGGIQNLMSGGGGGAMSLSLNSMDSGIPLSMGIENGFVKTGASGLNFNYDFGKKTALNSSYFFSNIRNSIDQEITRQNFLGDDQQFSSDQLNKMFNENSNHRLNLKLEHKIDSSQNIRLRTSLGYNDGSSLSDNESNTFNTKNELENNGLRSNFSDAEGLKLNSSLLYRKRLRKLGRVFVADLSSTFNENNGAARLNAINTFYPQLPENAYSDTLRQRQLASNNQFNYGAKFSFIEPLGKRRYLEFKYGYKNNSDKLDKDFYDLSEEVQGLEIYNPELSNHYISDYIYNTGGLVLKYNRKKYQWTTGLNLQHSTLKGNLLSDQSETNNAYWNLLPSFTFNREFSAMNSLAMRYGTSVREPSINQLNPIVDNSDPLNIFIGNPELRPAYNHNLNLNYTSFDQFTFTSLFVFLNATYTKNPIKNSRTLDSLFRQTVIPVNLEDEFSARASINFGTPIRSIKSKINIKARSMYIRGYDFFNGIENRTQRYINTFDLSWENRKKKVVDILIGGEVTHNKTLYSINKDFNQSFIDQNYYADLSIDFGETWSVSSSFDFSVYSDESFGAAQSIPLWQASLSKYILENRGEIKLIAVDILNRNVGINRSSSFNYLQEERINSLGRYFLLSFTWSLSKFGKNDSGIEIDMGERR